MKKITCFIESLTGGGAEHQMQILCDILNDRGYDVTLVTYADIVDHYSCNPNVHRVRLGRGQKKLGKIISIILYFLTVKTDCIISYRVSCNARVLFPLLFRPMVNVLVGERNLTTGPRSFYGKLCSNILYYRADHIISNSHSQESYLRSLCKRWGKKTCTIINYTDINLFTPSSVPVDVSVIRIAIFARISAQKNTVRFVNMLVELKKKSNINFHVDWYGSMGHEGQTSEYDKVYKLVEDYYVDDVFTIKAPVSNPSAFMGEYHAICLPSLYEGFSNSIAEGICSGKPMLVSDVSDNSVMVRDGVNGFLFDPTSIDNMVEVFMKFFNTSLEQKKQMGVKSREIAEKLFDIDLFFNKHKQLIES